MEKLNIQYVVIICWFILFHSTITLAQNSSRLRIEPVFYLSYGFSRFNPNTEATTSPNFYKYNAFGRTHTFDGKKGLDQTNESNRQYDIGVILHYELMPLLDINIGAQTSWVGAMGGYFFSASGGSTRVTRYSLSPVYRISNWRKHKVELHAGLGIMLDVVNKSTDQYTYSYMAGAFDTISMLNTSTIINNFGVSLHPNIQIKMKLENGNSFNIHFSGAIGLVPLISENFKYSRNQDKYYTELISNGSFFRIGIGYEFLFLRKIFTYPSIGTKYEHHY